MDGNKKRKQNKDRHTGRKREWLSVIAKLHVAHFRSLPWQHSTTPIAHQQQHQHHQHQQQQQQHRHRQ